PVQPEATDSPGRLAGHRLTDTIAPPPGEGAGLVPAPSLLCVASSRVACRVWPRRLWSRAAVAISCATQLERTAMSEDTPEPTNDGPQVIADMDVDVDGDGSPDGHVTVEVEEIDVDGDGAPDVVVVTETVTVDIDG